MILAYVSYVMIMLAIFLFGYNFLSALGAKSSVEYRDAHDWLGISITLFVVGILLLIISAIFYQ